MGELFRVEVHYITLIEGACAKGAAESLVLQRDSTNEADLDSLS